jgi:hypothetical protein
MTTKASQRQGERAFGFLFDKEGSLDDGCRYCGQDATDWDHVPPLHYVERLTVLEVNNLRLRKVPSCKECNSWLGASILITIRERRACIKLKFREKYKRYLETPAWAQDELEPLGYRMKQHVAWFTRQQEIARKRWENLR